MFTSPIPFDADAEEIFDRLTDEAVEGLDSFIERRKASWYPE